MRVRHEPNKEEKEKGGPFCSPSVLLRRVDIQKHVYVQNCVLRVCTDEVSVSICICRGYHYHSRPSVMMMSVCFVCRGMHTHTKHTRRSHR